MSANRLFLVCKYHQSPEDAICIAEREGSETPFSFNRLKHADEWFKKHQGCGQEGADHFVLAHHRTPSWDHSPAAQDTPAGAVRLAIATNGSGH